ncbi:MAG: phosphatase PAP2 family protein, partial [Candidatus Brocadiia bacterium]
MAWKTFKKLNIVDVTALTYLLGTLFLVLLVAPSHGAFLQVALTHLTFSAAIFVLASLVSPTSNPVLRFARYWYPVVLFAYLYPETGLINQMFIDHWLDPWVIGLDRAIFGVEPATVLPEVFRSRFFVEYFHATYFAYYLYLPVIGGLIYFLRDEDRFRRFMFTVSFAFFCYYLCFIIVPIVGPVACRDGFFTGFWPSVMDNVYALDNPGAAFPSSHVGIAIVVLILAFRSFRLAGLVMLPFVVSLA